MWRVHVLKVIRKPLLQIFTHSNESLFNYATYTMNKIKMFKIFQEGQCVILLVNYIEHLQQVYNTKLSGEGTVVSTLNCGRY